MPKRNSSSPATGDVLAQLNAKRDALVAQITEIDSILSGIANQLGTSVKREKPTQQPPTTPQRGLAKRATGHLAIPRGIHKPASQGPFYGLALAPAGLKQLASIADREAQTGAELWAALHKTGYNIKAANPVATLSWQLRKREKRVGDVILVGDGKFALSAWYTPEEIEVIKAARGGQPWRDRKSHSAQTRAGMKQAAEERGINIGRPVKLTPEAASQAEAMLLARKSVTDVATACGVSKATIYSFFRVAGRGMRVERKLSDEYYSEPDRQLRLVK